MTVKYKNWELEVDKEVNTLTYQRVTGGGADTCTCNDCKNYVAFSDKVFPNDILELFSELGVDYQKEVEIVSYEVLPNGLHRIGGWFHFKGRVVTGKDYRIPLSGGGYTLDLTKINDNFSIGFADGNDLTFFEDKMGLVQVEFDTNIPWVIDKSVETV